MTLASVVASRRRDLFARLIAQRGTKAAHKALVANAWLESCTEGKPARRGKWPLNQRFRFESGAFRPSRSLQRGCCEYSSLSRAETYLAQIR